MNQKIINDPKSPLISLIPPKNLLKDLKKMIDQARSSIAFSINTTLTLLHW